MWEIRESHKLSGDLKRFKQSFRKHVYIAKAYGPYKLSIHSGSHKFSIYPIAGKLATKILQSKSKFRSIEILAEGFNKPSGGRRRIM